MTVTDNHCCLDYHQKHKVLYHLSLLTYTTTVDYTTVNTKYFTDLTALN